MAESSLSHLVRPYDLFSTQMNKLRAEIARLDGFMLCLGIWMQSDPSAFSDEERSEGAKEAFAVYDELSAGIRELLPHH